jgi:NAD(P)-dependent dehydrogenase (short-subunit alcohol dehydrogenase family)
MKNKIKPLTLIVGSSSDISVGLIKNLEVNNKLLIITRNNITSNDNNIVIVHDLQKNPMTADIINNILTDEYYIKNLIYTSSYQAGRKKLTDLNNQEILDSFNVNVINLMILVKEIIKYRPNLPGSFIFFGSQATIFGGDRISAYAASKGAIEIFTKSLSKEVGNYGLRVNCISIGTVKTKQLLKDNFDEEKVIKTIPLNRLGLPMDVVNLSQWLLSDLSSYITGTIIPLAGGR